MGMVRNFYILGAPKCGTTSLAYWLSQHPEIAFSKPKETRFFNTDFRLPFRPESFDEYEKLFPVNSDTRLKGEATVNYLCSFVALKKILSYDPESKFIVCVRPHVDLFLSLHKQRLKEGIENIKDPAQAWQMQSARLRGKSVPMTCPDPELLNYSRFCMMGRQILDVYEAVGKDRVRLYTLEEIGSDPKDIFSDACEFLGLNSDVRISYDIKNVGSVPKFPFVTRVLRFLGLIRAKIGINPIGMATLIARLNVEKANSGGISSEFRNQLTDYFHEDATLLDSYLRNR